MRGLAAALGWLCVCLAVHVCTGGVAVGDVAYHNELGAEAQAKIRRLTQKLNLLNSPLSPEHAELSAELTRARRTVEHVRLLKRGMSHLHLVKVDALQEELDSRRAAMRSGAEPITPAARAEVAQLGRRIQALKKEGLAPLMQAGSIAATGAPLEQQIETAVGLLQRSDDLDEKRALRAQIGDLRALRVRQLERFVEEDMRLLQGYRRQLEGGDLSDLYRAVYREKVDAAYAVLLVHQQDLKEFKHRLTADEEEYNRRTKAQVNRLRAKLAEMVDPGRIARTRQEIEDLRASIVSEVPTLSDRTVPSL